MPKRDYKSYNVLDEELMQEEYGEENGGIQEDKGAVWTLENKINEQNDINLGIEQTDQHLEVENVTQNESDIEMDKSVHENKIDLEKRAKKEEKQEKQETVKEEVRRYNKDEDIEINKEVDMTFSGYKSFHQTKERSRFAKWSIRLMKFVLIIMLLPLLSIVGIGILTFLGGFIGLTVGTAASGLIILGSICFMASQINPTLVALGIAASITAFSLSGILLILFCMLMKWCINLFKKKKSDKKINKKEGR